MSFQSQARFPVFVICGRDEKRRRLMQELDPDGKVPVKALLPFLGKRIIDWQLEALAASPYVDQIYLLGLCEEHARFEAPVTYIPTELISSPEDKLSAGLQYLSEQGDVPPLVVVSTSDAPAVTRERVDEFMCRLGDLLDHDFILSVVPEALAERDFPRSGRVVARFRDHQVFPGELYALSPRAIQRGQDIIKEINQRRRKINRQASRITMGPILSLIAHEPRTWPYLFKFLVGRATLAEGERIVSLACQCKVKAIIIEDSGFGMDIDIPGDYQRLERFMQQRTLAA